MDRPKTWTRQLLEEYAQSYQNNNRDGDIDAGFRNAGRREWEFREWIKKHHYLDRHHFLMLCRWKSPRPARFQEKSTDHEIRTVTARALAPGCSIDERIRLLRSLPGVGWGVATTILHFAFPDEYSILDFRVLWSLGIPQPKSYSLNFWLYYCRRIRSLAHSFDLSIRIVDQALWEFSKQHQSTTKALAP
jgi:hypothetical protein